MEDKITVTKRGGARNTKSGEERRSGWAQFRVTKEEMEAIRELARAKGLPVATYIRSKALGLI
jgi:predicted DNA binding CopG/RHH family protein